MTKRSKELEEYADEGKCFIVYVNDYGCGVKTAEVERILKPFFTFVNVSVIKDYKVKHE